jgi:hypothetical protein
MVEVDLGVFSLVFSRLEEDGADLLEPLLLGYVCEVGVAVASLAFAGERFQ